MEGCRNKKMGEGGRGKGKMSQGKARALDAKTVALVRAAAALAEGHITELEQRFRDARGAGVGARWRGGCGGVGGVGWGGGRRAAGGAARGVGAAARRGGGGGEGGGGGGAGARPEHADNAGRAATRAPSRAWGSGGG